MRVIRGVVISLLVVLPVVLLLQPLASTGAAGQPAAVRVMLQWTHQAQFAGYYVAAAKGFYRANGLDVTILPGGPGIDPMNELGQGNCDFVSAWLSTALIRYKSGLQTVNVAQLVNRSNLAMISWKYGDDHTPQDLSGKRVSIWEGDLRAPYMAWLKAENVIPATVFPQYYSVNLFLRKGVYACSAMYYNELHMIYQAGVDEEETNVFFLKDYGLGFPEDGIYCTIATFRQRPEVVSAFRDATLAGWRYAAEHQQEALDIVMDYVAAGNVPTNRPHMKWMLEKMLTSIVPNGQDSWVLGKLGQPDYEQAVRMLGEQGMLSDPPAYAVFTGEVMADVP